MQEEANKKSSRPSLFVSNMPRPARPDLLELLGVSSLPRRGGRRQLKAEAGKQSKKTLLDVFERYLERHMTLFDTI